MGEISSTVAEAIRNRATSTFLITYSLFWLAWHWQGVYVSLFTNEDLIFGKHGLLKNEYVNQYFFGWHGWETIIGFVAPLILSIIFVWPIQKFIIIHFYKLEQTIKTSRRKIRIDEDEEVEKHKAKLINQRTKKVEAETKKVKAVTKKVEAETQLAETTKRAVKTDPKISWDIEYATFKTSKHYQKFKLLLDSVYSHSGLIRDDYSSFGDYYEFEIPNDLLIYADSNSIIKLSADKKKIDFTEKGKYFVKLFSQEG